MIENRRSIHGAELTALIFAGLGWVTFGILAIPGVIIAHCLGATGAATSIVTKTTFRVGYTAIAISATIALKLWISARHVYSEVVAAGPRMMESEWQLNHQRGSSEAATEALNTSADSHLALWLSVAGIAIALLLVMPPLMNWMRRSQMKAQSDRIMRMNRNR